jgi:putative acetyltransferase
MSDLELSYEGAADVAAITRTVAAAFGQKAEAELVSALREAGALTLSLVARLDGEVVGHVALSPVAVAGRQADDWLGLAPLAVAPAHQRIGIGSALARRALELAAVRGAAAVFVLGEPDYYGRLGFEPAAQFGWRCKYDVPAAAFRVRRLGRAADLPPAGIVTYHPAFDAL